MSLKKISKRSLVMTSTALVVGLSGGLFGCNLLSKNNVAAQAEAAPGTTKLGSIDGKDIMLSDLSNRERSEIYKAQKQFFEVSQNVLAGHYFHKYIEDYQKKNNIKSPEEAKKDFFDKNATVDQKTVDDFLKQNASAPELQRIPEAQRATVVKDYLSRVNESKAQQKVVQTALADGRILVSLTQNPPKEVVTFDTKGYTLVSNSNSKALKSSAQPKVTITEFADYECPYCVMAHKEIKKVLEHFNKPGKEQVQFVYYDFPLSFHPQATPASVAAYCANEQGKFWEMQDKIFDRGPRDPLTPDTYNKAATALGLDMKKFETCLKDPKANTAIAAHTDQGSRVGVEGTPSIFINGVRLESGASFDALKDKIDEALKNAK